MDGKPEAVNPQHTGTKAAAHYTVNVPPGDTATIRLRLSDAAPAGHGQSLPQRFAQIMGDRQREADEFYRAITPPRVTDDEARVMRQALAGMLWSKQYFGFDVDTWLEEHGVKLMPPGGNQIRNSEWFSHGQRPHHLDAGQMGVSLVCGVGPGIPHHRAIHCRSWNSQKSSLILMLQEFFLHPTGQIPAYEWNFSDVNPPVHAWATTLSVPDGAGAEGARRP